MMAPLVLGSLFTGIGGFDLAARQLGIPLAFMCEIDPFCRAVLRKNFGCLPVESLTPEELILILTQWRRWQPGRPHPPTILYGDIKQFRAECWRGIVTLVCGGYPCQSQSGAGKRRGQQDDRWLWPEMRRLYREARPRWVVGENVFGHFSLDLDAVLSDLETDGYETWPLVIPACGAGAPHQRDRIWFAAHTLGEYSKAVGTLQTRQSYPERSSTTSTNSNGKRCSQCGSLPEPGRTKIPWAGGSTWWPAQSPLCAGNDGLPSELVRPARRGDERSPKGWRTAALKAVGNALVPQIPQVLFGFMLEIENAC